MQWRHAHHCASRMPAAWPLHQNRLMRLTQTAHSQELCEEAHKRWALKAAAIAHRVGEVRIGEASVIIAVSSAHRQAALEACSTETEG